MKIAWLTPLAHTSAIGRYSRLVLRELAKLHDVQAWTFGDSAVPEMAVPVRVVPDHRRALAELQDFDLCVYQIGNHWGFHGEIFLTAMSRPGIIVLHDYTLQHLFAAYAFEYLRDPDTYVTLMRQAHGEDAAAEALAAQASKRPQIWETDEATLYPLTPVVTENALGVVAHSHYALSGLRAHYQGPAAVLPLPYATEAVPQSEVASEDIGVPDNALLVITAGHMNPNKLVKQVVVALGTMPERLKLRLIYALLGPVDIWYKNELTAAAEAAGLQGRVRLEGYVTDARLLAYMNRADLCVNLRFPNYEGASASVIEQLLAGKPVIVSNTGSFAELPADVVCRIDSEAGLPHALESLLVSSALRKDMAERALRFAQPTYRADTYASAFSALAATILHERPVRDLQRAITGHAHRIGLRSGDRWLCGVNELVCDLFLGR